MNLSALPMTDPQDLPIDDRASPRIQLPFEVEVSHPTIGRVHGVARDISEGGIFVRVTTTGLRAGAKVKVTVLSAALIESNPTPTVDMEVARVTDEGLGLRFANRTSRHLWESVHRLREELQLGKDYFQIFQGAAIVNPLGKLLVVQRHGKWLFPGEYLTVGAPWRTALLEFLTAELGLDNLAFEDALGVDSGTGVEADENATFSAFYRFSSTSENVRVREGGRYRHAKWVSRSFSLEELTFSHPKLKEFAALALERAETQRELASGARSRHG